MASAFQPPSVPSSTRLSFRHGQLQPQLQLQRLRTKQSLSLLHASSPSSDTEQQQQQEEQQQVDAEKQFDEFLSDGNLRRAIRYFKDHPGLDMTRQRWSTVFDTMEDRLRNAEQERTNSNNNNNDPNGNGMGQMPARGEAFPLNTPARAEVTDMYTTLKDLQHLRLFGAVDTKEPLAAGSHTVTPVLLEQVSGMSMQAMTPKPTNTLLIAGVVLSAVEAFISAYFGLDFNVLVFATLAGAFADQVLVNGAIFDTFVKFFYPSINNKILRHEAGHFLAAYLLGCPVEGFVLSPWAARADARFEKSGVTAGTSFFDPTLSEQINSSVVSRSSLDRYSIIVMAGIAAEAMLYGQADGGAGDEAALVSFLSQLNGSPKPGKLPPWNDISIRNQARWGALQAVLMMKEYRPCYDALVDTLERGGSLGDCIFAIEKAGRDNNLRPADKPLGYILDEGLFGEWSKELPADPTTEGTVGNTAATTGTAATNSNQGSSTSQTNAAGAALAAVPAVPSKEDALEMLKQYRKQTESRLKEIEEQLGGNDS